MDTTTSSTFEASPPDAARPGSRGPSEVIAKRTRRRFSLAYKRRILALVAGLPAGEIGALLRRERLYSSHLTAWRQQLAELDAAVPEPRRGRKPDPKRPERLRIEKLEQELAKAQQRLQQAEAIIDAQKKLCALLGLPSSEVQP
jgi:transposase-like protein